MNIDDINMVATLKGKGKAVNVVPVNAFAIDEEEFNKLVYIEMLTRSTSLVNRYLANWRKNRHTTSVVGTDIYLRNVDSPGHQIQVMMQPKEKIFEIHHKNIHGWANLYFAETELGYLFGGDESTPAPHFLQCMHTINVPMLDRWTPTFWRAGIKGELIRPLFCYRVKAWKINKVGEPWQEILKYLVETKEVTA